MSNSHRDLAARFRTSILDKNNREQADQDRQVRQEEAAQRARDEILSALEEFADEARFFEVTRTSERLILRYDGQTLRFEPDRSSPHVHVRCSQLGQECRLEFNTLRRCWQILFIAPRGRSMTFDLLPQGLEMLISRCFGLRAAPSPRAAETSGACEERKPSRFFR